MKGLEISIGDYTLRESHLPDRQDFYWFTNKEGEGTEVLKETVNEALRKLFDEVM